MYCVVFPGLVLILVVNYFVCQVDTQLFPTIPLPGVYLLSVFSSVLCHVVVCSLCAGVSLCSMFHQEDFMFWIICPVLLWKDFALFFFLSQQLKAF